MYTDEDLNEAVEKGIFNSSSVYEFKQHISQQRNAHPVDEENFRLLNSFNDIFVVIASGLLLVSLTWLGWEITPVLGPMILAAGSWGLAEVFVLRKRMALPAIGLLLSFLAGCFATPIAVNSDVNEIQFLVAAALTISGAWLHWRRFHVPITLAAGVVGFFAGVYGIVYSQFPLITLYYQTYMLIAGLITFAFAMMWDAKDPKRETRSSDVAFWLHLVAAPLIAHPIFQSLGVFSGITDYSTASIVIALYVVLAMISIVVDRRAIMVSALAYVVYAMSGLLENYGLVSYSLAVTGVIIGGSLLFLSVYWHSSRKSILHLLPQRTQAYLPSL